MDYIKGTFLFTVALFFLALIGFIIKLIKKPHPKLTLIYSDSEGLKYKNIGNDTAHDIKIEERELNLFSIFFKPLPLLEPKEEKSVEITKIAGRTQFAETVLMHEGEESAGFPFFEGLKVDKYSLVINYGNIKHKQYISVIWVECKNKLVRHWLYGRMKWISFLDSVGLIKLPKPL